jgi:acetyl-CoA acetyltransferase
LSRYPIRDQVAIVGVGTTDFSRDAGRSELGLVVDASKKAIRNAGLSKEDIDGMSGTMCPAHIVQGALGVPRLNWFVNSYPTFPQQIVNAMNAVFSGACETVLAYHGTLRGPGNSKSAKADPFRLRPHQGGPQPQSYWPDGLMFAPSYAAWCNRYFHEYGGKREYLGYIAVNSRTNALANEHALLRTPLSMDDYLAARMVRPPWFGVLDMDYPIDGADAFVITTAERAKDLPNKPVLIHAASLGQTDHTVEESMPDINHTAHQVTMDRLWEHSDLELKDVDLFQPYDGFSFICLKWFENVGYCKTGEAGPFIEANWDAAANRIMIDGRIPVNTHGGSLSDGGTQGSGHIREAVLQLQGAAGDHQFPNVKSVLVPAGGFFMYTGGLLLRSD